MHKKVTGPGFEATLDFSDFQLKTGVQEIAITQSGSSRAEGDRIRQQYLGPHATINAAIQSPPSVELRRWNAAADRFIPVSVMLMKAKQFDDGLLAALELLLDCDSQSVIGRRRLIRELAAAAMEAASTQQGSALLCAAAKIQGDLAAHDLPDKARALLETFLAQPNLSKPLAFYSWNDELKSLFQRDRLLQRQLSITEFTDVIKTLNQRADLKNSYLFALKLSSLLNNPLTSVGLATAISTPDWTVPNTDEETMFFPSSYSVETAFASLAKPDGPSVIDELVAAIKYGSVQFRGGPDVPWYESKLWALQTLLTLPELPENERLLRDFEYAIMLVEIFKGFMTLTRETHLKSLDIGIGCAGPERCPRIVFQPAVSLEPIPSLYLRKFLSYSYLRKALVSLLGVPALASARRLHSDGASSLPLLEELELMEQIFGGAFLTACDDLALPAGLFIADMNVDVSKHCKDAFNQFADQVETDQDLNRDARCMVPVSIDDAGKVRTWVFLGWSSHILEYQFGWAPRVVDCKITDRSQIVDGDVAGDIQYEFGSTSVLSLQPVSCEVIVDTVMDRKEFQAFCDKHKLKEDIIAALQGRYPSTARW